jgi:eukaryotic-like serine/threonine-protein kinase
VTLTPGTKLGPYEIVAPLGAGGMGEVFRARDARLGRDVAIKALPAAFAQDPERLARFEREAKLLASLNHPNVAGIHGVEEVEGTRYLVLEFVDGETLEAHLRRGAPSLAEVLDVALQVAAGVEAAHEAGVIHRDLKPGNVMITPAGSVKVLDFGLAKGGSGRSASSSDPQLSASPTMTYQGTEAGVILGTAAYMSPEQARGKAVDRRTDIWSFGCVLYEMLAGRRVYDGETVSDMVARILEREPDWSALPASTPPRLLALLRRCLAKDAKRRQRDIGDVRLDLEAIAAGDTGAAPAAVAAPAATRGAPAWALALGALVLLAFGAAGALLLARAPGTARTMHVSVLPPEGAIIDDDQTHAAISPDGSMLVFVATDSSGTSQLWLRELSSAEPRPLPNTQDAILPFWSPDNRFIGFFAEGRLKKADVAGRTVQVVCDAPDGRGGAWSRRGHIVFAPSSNGPLMRVAGSGGPVTAATRLDTTRHDGAHRFPSFLADGRRFVYVSLGDSSEMRLGLPDGSSRPLELTTSGGAVCAPGDFLLYPREGALMAQQLDAASGRMRGEAHVLGAAPISSRYAGAPAASVSANGVLMQRHRLPKTADLAWFDRSGRPAGRVPAAPGPFFDLALSPDGRHAALARAGLGNQTDIWSIQLETGLAARVSVDQVDCEKPVWSPDGRWIAYSALERSQRTLYRKLSDGAGPPERLVVGRTGFLDAAFWSADGRELLVRDLDPVAGEDIWKLSPVSDSTLHPVLRARFHEEDAKLSPDGRWLAYRSNESGRPELYVQSYPVPDSRVRVSRDGAGTQSRSSFGRPFWRADGRELVYVGGDGVSVISVLVEYAGTPHFGPPHTLFKIPRGCFELEANTDLQRFLALQQRSSGEDASIQLLMNWPAELKGK